MRVKEVLQKIDGGALFKLCEGYDQKEGAYPEHPYEGDAIYRFYRELCAEEAEEGSGFVTYIKENATIGSLREMFYNYFIAHLGTLYEDDKECEEEIKRGLSLYFKKRK